MCTHNAHELRTHIVLEGCARTMYCRGMPTNRLAELRRGHALSQAALAAEMNVIAGTVWRWEHGKVTIPDDKKRALAKRFGVSVDTLMGWDTAAV